MTENKNYPEWINKLADDLLSTWRIGTVSSFCDEVDWDSATVEELSQFIWERFQKSLDNNDNIE